MESVNINRRRFLGTGLATALGMGGMGVMRGLSAKEDPHAFRPDSDKAGMWTPKTSTGNTSTKPNILWIQTDEQRPDSLGCYGSEWAHTPNLDALAKRGTTFTECHAQSPVCVPSRTSMMFCKYPQETEVYDNNKWGRDGFISPETPTWVNLLRNNGYHAVNLGKWHTPNHPTWDENVLFDLFPEVTGYYELGPDYKKDEERLRVIQRPSERDPIIIGGKYPYHDWGVTPSSYLTDLALDKIDELNQNVEPWLLRVSYIWPHTPVLAPEPWDRLYDPKTIPNHALNRDAYNGRSDYDRWFADYQGGFKLSREEWAQCAADYYGLCSSIDYEVGRLIQYLDQQGLADNTIIAFNSDHGRSLGEAGLCEKGTYDREVWRVPSIISSPGSVPVDSVDDGLCELMDFGPTICALCDVEMAEGMRGRDLFNTEAPESVFGIIDIGPYRRAGVRNGKYRMDCTVAYDYKLRRREDWDPNLFDLSNDPLEDHNLAKHPEYKDILDSLYDELENWLIETDSKTYGQLKLEGQS